MRARTVLVGSILATLVGLALPTGASEGPSSVFHLTAPVPCHLTCPYWIDTAVPTRSCDPQPITTPGSYDQLRLPVPEDGRPPAALRVRIFPHVDWDLVICRVLHDALGPTERWQEVTFGDSVEPCRGELPPTPVYPFPTPYGCPEVAVVPVQVGETYVIRAYNFADGPFLVGEYSWLFARHG